MKFLKWIQKTAPKILSLMAFRIAYGVALQQNIWPIITAYWLGVCIKWFVDDIMSEL